MQLLSLLRLAIRLHQEQSERIDYAATVLARDVVLAAKLSDSIVFQNKKDETTFQGPDAKSMTWERRSWHIHQVQDVVGVQGVGWLFRLENLYEVETSGDPKKVVPYDIKSAMTFLARPNKTKKKNILIAQFQSNLGLLRPGDDSPDWGFGFQDFGIKNLKPPTFFADLLVTDDRRILLEKAHSIYEAHFVPGKTPTLGLVAHGIKLLYAAGAGMVIAESLTGHGILLLDQVYKRIKFTLLPDTKMRFAFVSSVDGFGVQANGPIWTFCHGTVPNVEAHQIKTQRPSPGPTGPVSWFRQLPAYPDVFCTIRDTEVDFWKILTTGAFVVKHIQTVRANKPILQPNLDGDHKMCFVSDAALWELDLSRIVK